MLKSPNLLSAAVDDHEKTLKSILRKTPAEFEKWLESLSDEELTYIEWLLDKVDLMVDDILLEQSAMRDAKAVIEKISHF